jgi:hypothetical protein
MNDKLKKYPASAFDENLRIKISISLWLAIVFLLRPYAVMLLSLANMSDHTQLIHLLYANDTTFALGAAAALPALVLFIAWTKRRPDSGATIRWIWHHGRALLMMSAVLNLIIVGISAFWAGRGPQLADVTQAILTVYIILYLYRSERVRDTFRDFL